MKQIIPILAILIFGTAGCQSTQNHGPAPMVQHDLADARRLALTWLALVDEEKYSEAYEQYNESAKKRTKSKSSMAFYRAIRQPHGRPLDRRIVREAHMTQLPLLPPSEYGVFDFATDFASETGVYEQVLTEYKDGKWEITGYACHN